MNWKWFSLLFGMAVSCAEISGNELKPQMFAKGSGGGALLCRGNLLYAALQKKLCIYDVSEPLKPVLLSAIQAAGNRQFALSGNRLYLSCRARGVQIFDISNPKVPKELNRFYPVELATGLTVSGNVLGVAQRIYGVEFFDVSDAKHPRSMGLLRTGEAQSAAFFGQGRIAIGDWGDCQAVIGDVTDPAHPKILSRSRLDGFGDGVAVRGNLLFAATGHKAKKGRTNGHGLTIFNIDNMKKPKRVGSVMFPGTKEAVPDWWQVCVSRKYAFVSDSYNGVYAVDITDPGKPRIAGHIQLGQDAASQIAIGNGVLYISGHQTGLYCVPHPEAKQLPPEPDTVPAVPAPAAPEIAGLKAQSVPGFVWSLTIDGDRLYASCGHEGVREYRILPDGSLKEERVFKGSCFDCKIYNGLLFMAQDDFMEVFDRKNNRSLCRIPAKQGFFQFHIYQNGKLLVSSGRTSRLEFWDITAPAKPRLIRTCSGTGIHYGDMLPEQDVNGLFIVNWHAGLPTWYKADKRPDPAFFAKEELRRVSNQACGVTLCRGKFLLFAKRNKVLMLDPATPEQHQLLSVSHRDGIPSADGDVLALSERRSATVTFYRFDGRTLKLIPQRKYQLPFTVTGRCVFFHGKVYIPAGAYGIFYEMLCSPYR